MDSVKLTKNEIIVSLQNRDLFLFAIVEADRRLTSEPKYFKGALVDRQPSFAQVSVNYCLKKLLSEVTAPC